MKTKILQIVIAEAVIDELAPEVSRALQRGPGEERIAWGWQMDPRGMRSPILLSTGAVYPHIVKTLRDAGVEWWEERDLSGEFRCAKTNAPAVFDYESTMPIGSMSQHGATLRIVAAPKGAIDYQVARYRSGMKYAEVCTEEEVADV